MGASTIVPDCNYPEADLADLQRSLWQMFLLAAPDQPNEYAH